METRMMNGEEAASTRNEVVDDLQREENDEISHRNEKVTTDTVAPDQISLEEDRDDIPLCTTTTSTTTITKTIDSYLLPKNSQDDDSSEDEEERNNKIVNLEEPEEFEEPGEDHLNYELVDDGYANEIESQHSDEEYGEFHDANVSHSEGYHAAINGDDEEKEGEGMNGNDQETNSINQSSEYRIPSFPINKSSIPPLTAGI